MSVGHQSNHQHVASHRCHHPWACWTSVPLSCMFETRLQLTCREVDILDGGEGGEVFGRLYGSPTSLGLPEDGYIQYTYG